MRLPPGEETIRHIITPIQPILDGGGATEIVINNPGSIGVERGGQWDWIDVPEFNLRRLEALAILAAHYTGKDFGRFNPLAASTLPGGERITLVGHPVMPNNISMTIRIPARGQPRMDSVDFSQLMDIAEKRRAQPLTQSDLELVEAYKDTSEDGRKTFFRKAVRARKNIAAIGATGSGKTYFLNTLIPEIDRNERVITIEKTYEFVMPHVRNRVAMLFGVGGVSAMDCVEQTLQMRPDRVLMQELTGKEAFSCLRAMAGGHQGSLLTFHANEGDPWSPLAIMAKQANEASNYTDGQLKEMFRSLIDIVIHFKREGDRRFPTSVWFRQAKEAAHQ